MKFNSIVVVHIISDFFNSGADILVSNIHNDFNDEQFTSHIISLNAHQSNRTNNIHCLKVKGVYNPILILKISKKINAIINDNSNSHIVIHTHLTAPFIFTPISSFFFKKRCLLVTTEHSTNNRRKGSYFGRLIDFLLYKQYRSIVCISEGVRNISIKYLKHINPLRFVVIANGINLNNFKKILTTDSPRLKLISIGRLESMKNYERAIYAVANLVQFDFDYIIYGEGSQRNNLEKLIIDLNLSDKVNLFGHCNDVRSALIDADLFIMPSIWEGFGLSAIEAMAGGLPIIISNVDGLNELILNSDSEIGYLVDPIDINDIQNKIEMLLSNCELRKMLGNNAYEESKKYSIRNTIYKHKQLYRKLLDENSTY